MPAVAGGVFTALTGSPAASAIAGLPTTAGPALTSTGIPALGLTGGGVGATGVGSAGGIAVIGGAALAGGFLVGDNVVRPLLGIEYPGGGGFNDYRNRRTGGREALMNQAAQSIPINPDGSSGGQTPGVQYRVTATADIQGSQFNGTREALVYGPVTSVSPQFCRGSLGSISWGLVIQASDAAGNPGTFYGGPCTVWTGDSPIGDAKQISTGPTIERADGQPDVDPRPGRNRAPGLVNPPVLNPSSAPPNRAPTTAPRPATPSAPPTTTPAVPPTTSPEPVEPNTDRPPYPSWLPPALAGLGVAGLAGLAGRTRGNPGPSVPPLTQPAPRVPPTPPSTPTPTNNCGCNAGIGRAIDRALGTGAANLAGQGASTAGILGKLNQMQNFAEAAWKNTHLDKAINALTLLGVLHNAYYISTDLAFTFGEFVSLGLSAVGIKDEGGGPLDINSLVRNQFQSIINNLIGEEQALAISQRLSRFGRIFRAGTNIVWTLRNIQDTTADVLELTANNTGKIGNALKRSGVVDRLSYPWMPTNVQASDLWRRKFQRVFDGLEQAEDTLGAAYGVTANVLELGEEVSFLSQQKQQFIDEVTTGEDVPGLENQTIADTETLVTQESVSPDLDGVPLDNANSITP